MTERAETGTVNPHHAQRPPDGAPGAGRAGIPVLVWIGALLAALLHMLPYWHAQLGTPAGFEFTGNLTVSPDYMQYRVWERQSVREGPIVTNAFTPEPNRPHLPVLYYWAIGRTASSLGVRPEAVYAYSGSALAAALALLAFVFVRRYLADATMRWWAWLAIMVGGGLGGHLKVLESTPVLNRVGIVRRLLIDPLATWPVFEEYRGHYVFRALFDSHFLLLWVVALLGVLALARAVERYSTGRALLAAAAFAGMTLLHVYEGITLLAIAAAFALVSWRRPDERRVALRALGWCSVGVLGTYAGLGALYARSGLPLPAWRAVNVLFSIVVLAFPLSWWLMAIGLRDYWQRAGLPERFLLAWAGACTALTLAGPFYPYPDRGTLTMSVPVTIVGAAIYGMRFGRPSRRAALVAVAVLSALPVWQLARTWYFSRFREDAPFMYVTAAHRDVIRRLAGADPKAVLLAEPPDLLWLAPEYPGKFWVGHFFLTVDYRARHEALRAALAQPDSLPSLLRRSGARWLFVNATRDVSRIARLPQLTPVTSSSLGTLFGVRLPGGD